MGYFEVLGGILAIVFLLYYYFTSTYGFWKARGVVGPKPLPVIGNMKPVLTVEMSMGEFLKNIYMKYKNERMVGIFTRRTPVLVLNDPDLIKDVLIKDFSNFADRGVPVAKVAEPLTQGLFSLEPELWRPLRTRLSPTFTSGRLKDMFLMIRECSEHLEEYVEKVVEKNEPVEIRDLTAKFTTDVIGTCAFGIDTKALASEESEFRKMGRKIFKFDFVQMLRFRCRQFAPRFYNFLGHFLPHTEVATFFIRLTMDTLEYRRKNNIVRNDFINTLLEIQNHPDKLGIGELTEGFIAAQAFVFFVAGFETSSTTMSNALYELAIHQEIQDKLREEIKETDAKNNGDLRYETIKEMKYLDCIFRETLRKYPPVTLLMRKSHSEYKFANSEVSIPAKTMIWIPIYGIQHDPDYFPDPEKFDPERFTEENMAARHPMHFLSFGDGPRNCIGARFAVYQTKIGLIKILRNYKVDVCEKTVIPYKVEPKSFLLSPKGGIHLKISKIKKS